LNGNQVRDAGARRTKYSTLLLVCTIIFLFIVPAFPQAAHKMLYNAALTLLLVFAAISMDRYKRSMYVIAFTAIVIEWVANLLEMPVIMGISQSVIFIYFIMVVIGLIHQVATTKSVTARVIVESITGYLLMGIVFSIIVMIIARTVPGAYAIAGKATGADIGGTHLNELIYYAFTNYTTLGYGDIVPLVPISRAVSTLAGVTGQLYLTVIIATLVGKFLSARRDG